MGMQIGAVTVESSNGDTSKKLKMDVPFGPAIPLLGIYPKEPKNTNSKEYKNKPYSCKFKYSYI